jgi:hypothetical protein
VVLVYVNAVRILRMCVKVCLIQDDQKVSVHLTITVQKTLKYSILNIFITNYILNVDRAIVNTVFENTVRRVNKCEVRHPPCVDLTPVHISPRPCHPLM